MTTVQEERVFMWLALILTQVTKEGSLLYFVAIVALCISIVGVIIAEYREYLQRKEKP